jgi:N-acyl amino acid synthase of PEP-CTERM/exosortase system
VSAVPAPPPVSVERRGHDLVLGLYRSVYRTSKRLGLTHWYAAMEDKLWVLLRRLGFEFEQIGPFHEYHGRRAPFLGEIATIERIVRDRRPAMYEDFTRGL